MGAVIAPGRPVAKFDGWISTADLADESGASYRQVDYWISNGVIEVANNARGSGNWRRIDARWLPIVRTLALVSSAFAGPGYRGTISSNILRQIVEVHEDGELCLPNGICITWEVDA